MKKFIAAVTALIMILSAWISTSSILPDFIMSKKRL